MICVSELCCCMSGSSKNAPDIAAAREIRQLARNSMIEPGPSSDPAASSSAKSFRTTQFAAPAHFEWDVSQEQEEQLLIANLEDIALKLQGTVRKFPKSNKTFLRKPQTRFIAILPQNESPSGERYPLTSLQRYQQGWLAYWETTREYDAGEKPKGYISLLRIAKVHHEPNGYDGCGVFIKHKTGDEPRELLLLLPNPRHAQEFSYMLWEFIAKIRGEWADDSIQTRISGLRSLKKADEDDEHGQRRSSA